jgi:Tfp pilus assembly pilus retraction ATPase PilT
MLKSKYEVCVCLQDNTCSTLEDPFCYVFNEQTFILEARGFNSEVKEVKNALK